MHFSVYTACWKWIPSAKGRKKNADYKIFYGWSCSVIDHCHYLVPISIFLIRKCRRKNKCSLWFNNWFKNRTVSTHLSNVCANKFYIQVSRLFLISIDRIAIIINNLYRFNSTDWDRLLKTYEENKTALTFISNYEPADVAAIKFSIDSASVWSISPPDHKRMLDEIISSKCLHFL